MYKNCKKIIILEFSYFPENYRKYSTSLIATVLVVASKLLFLTNHSCDLRVNVQHFDVFHKMGELGRKGWKEVSGTAPTPGPGGYGQVGGENFHSPGERSSLVGSGNGYGREEDWSTGSQQGSK